MLKTVCIDYQHGIRQAVQHLAAMGHIALVSGPPHLKTASMRKMAFQACMNEIGLDTPPELLREGDHTMEAGTRAMSGGAGCFAKSPLGGVLLNDLTAISIMRQAFELSIMFRRNYLSSDSTTFNWRTSFPPLTTVRMSQSEIADAAFGALLDSVECERTESLRNPEIVKTTLVLRRSTTLSPRRRM